MNEFENSSIDLEQLLRSKSWAQLSGSEQSEVLKFVSGSEEYEQMYAMVHQLKTTAGVHDADMKPSRDVRESLLMAFDTEQKKRKAGWWTNISFFLNQAIRFDIPVVRVAVMAVLLIGVVYGAMKLMKSDEQLPSFVKNETTQPAAPAPAKENPEQPDVAPQQTPQQPQNNVVRQNDDVIIAPQNNNQPQIVQAPLPMVIDTNTENRIAMVPDSNAVVMPLTVITNGGTNAFCCGTSNGTIISPTATGATNYTWTNSGTANVTNVVGVNGLPTRSRSLANDAAVLDVFYAVK